MGHDILAGRCLLASEEAGGRIQLTSSVILSVSLAGGGAAAAQQTHAISGRRFQEIPLDV